MKIELNGVICDTDNDDELCGSMSSLGELTLCKNKKGEFYTHIVVRDEFGDVSGQEIELNTKKEAAEIMFQVGFSFEMIEKETGWRKIGEAETKRKKKHMHKNYPLHS